jgi:hypothetical protein
MDSTNFVFAASPGLLTWNGLRIMLNVGNAWYADDPLVLDRPELFSATPIEASSTTGRPPPGATPIGARDGEQRRERRIDGRPRRG